MDKLLPLYLILVTLFNHWIADFVLQSDWMAQNKSKNNWILGVHITAYTAWMALGMWYFLGFINAVEFALLNGAAHYCTDYFSSRMTSKRWAQKRVHDFFVVIGADQWIHSAFLMLFLTLYV